MKSNCKRAMLMFLIGAVIALSASAHETDQFTLPMGREFADLGGYLNNWIYGAIEKGVDKTNQRIDLAVKQRYSKGELANLQSSDEIVRAVNSEFPNAYDVIEGINSMAESPQFQKRYPGLLVGYKEQFTNVYEHVHFVLDPRQFFRLWHACTIKAYGTYLGADKMGHFTDMGMHYYKAFSEARARGATEDAATAAAVQVGTKGPIFSERGMVGYLSAGDYSNGDLAANFLGLLFYRNLTEPVMIKGKLRPPMLVRDGALWKIAPHVRRDSDFFAPFISDHLDEGLNPGLFEADMRDPIRVAVQLRTPIILARRCDEHGNRRPKSYFDQRLEELKTYYGQDYGHDGNYEQLVSIGTMCFEEFRADAKPGERNRSGNTPLHQAAIQGDRRAAQRLIQQGADVNTAVRSAEPYSSEWGNTPLHFAARDGRKDVAELLIDSRANVNASNDRGQTPLHRALAYPQIVELLIRHGAQVNAQADDGQTPLHWAAGDRESGAVDLLLANGAQANARDNTGQTPLHLAARSGTIQDATALLSHGGDVNAKASLGATPLHLAAARGNQALIDLLIAKGADVRAADEFGWTALHDAAENGRDQAAATLLDHNAQSGATDIHGNTPLHIAAREGCDNVVALLVARGAQINSRNNTGATPLHEASFAGRTSVVAELISHGADTAAKNQRGMTPLDVALSKGYQDIAGLLRSGKQIAWADRP